MQNKPNFRKAKMNVSIFSKMAYENKSNWTLGQNKPNSNPISKPAPARIRMALKADMERLNTNKPLTNFRLSVNVS
jgi:hypothetical protein